MRINIYEMCHRVIGDNQLS